MRVAFIRRCALLACERPHMCRASAFCAEDGRTASSSSAELAWSSMGWVVYPLRNILDSLELHAWLVLWKRKAEEDTFTPPCVGFHPLSRSQ